MVTEFAKGPTKTKRGTDVSARRLFEKTKKGPKEGKGHSTKKMIGNIEITGTSPQVKERGCQRAEFLPLQLRESRGPIKTIPVVRKERHIRKKTTGTPQHQKKTNKKYQNTPQPPRTKKKNWETRDSLKRN